MNKTIICCASALILAACGGSSSDNSPNGRPTIPPPVETDIVGTIEPLMRVGNVSLFGDADMTTMGSYGFALIPDESTNIESVRWTQLSGPSLTILAPNSQTIGFDIREAGDYSLSANINTNSGTQTIQHSFSVQESNLIQANVRLDHTVTERGKVSLRVGSLNGDITGASVTWTQTAGPRVLDFAQGETTPSFLTFNLPEVSNDEVIQIRANVTFADGTTAADTSIMTVKDANINDEAFLPSIGIVTSEDMFAFNANSPYKQALESCVYNNVNARSCNFSQLPLIGQVHDMPTVDDILDRTVVSHPWMGERFRGYLEQSAAGQDMLALLRGVTAVVISYDIRPSFYWTATGAIYLDARNFWGTAAERDTLNEAPDFRSNFGSTLQVGVFWRYVKDNQPYMPGQRFSINERESRTFEALEADISWLMYHELGHANDFFPPSLWPSLSMSTNPLAAFRANGTDSDSMIQSFPLTSAQLKDLAQVSFAGQDPNTAQRGYTGDDIQRFFEPDSASSYYSYLNEREDYATLFERFMMQYRLGASADVGIINTVDNPTFDVTWGQRDRFNDPKVQDRLRFTVNRVYPELGDIRSLQENELPSPVFLRSGVPWNSNIDLSSGSGDAQLRGKGPLLLDPRDNHYMLLEGHHHRERPLINAN